MFIRHWLLIWKMFHSRMKLIDPKDKVTMIRSLLVVRPEKPYNGLYLKRKDEDTERFRRACIQLVVP